MLARGQVVPLSMTLELLKSVVNLTCSDHLVIENCPSHVDDIEHLSKEFRIDRVFHISGDKAAVESWKSAFLKGREDRQPRDFDERAARLNSIVTHFSRLGKLTRLDVSARLGMEEVTGALERATLPKFVVLAGDSAPATGAQAGLLVAALGTGPAVTGQALKEQSSSADLSVPEEYVAALKKYTNAKSASSLFVLDQFPASVGHAQAFMAAFGNPKVVVHIACSGDQLMNEWKEANGDAEEPEDLAEQLAAQQRKLAEAIGVFKEKCPSSVLNITKSAPDGDAEPEKEQAEAQEHNALIRGKLLPSVYAIVAPAGDTGFSGLVADAISTAKKEGAPALKYTTIDCGALPQKGGHGTDIEDALTKASFTGDGLTGKLWTSLLQEALGKGADPMGTFLVSNFPTASGLPVRDQFMMLGDVAILAGIVHVRLSKDTFAKYCSEDPAKADAYASFDSAVCAQIADQFEVGKVCACSVEDWGSPEQAAAQIAAQFLAHFCDNSAEAAPGFGAAAEPS
jgi:adenylate kinase family enzyme